MKKVLFFLMIALTCFTWGAKAQQPLPYSYGFENNDLSVDGWTLFGSTSSSTRIISTATHDGEYGFQFHYSEQNAYLVSPLLTGATYGVTVSFYYKEYSASYGDEQFYVGYTTDETNEDPTTFTYGSIVTASTSWQLYETTLPAGTKRIAIKYVYNDAFYLYLDDFTFAAPASCVKPTGLEATLTPGNGAIATLSWNENGTATNWVLEYGTASDFTGATPVIVSGTPTKDLTGLSAETKYYARVKANCGGGDVSDWSATCEFKPTNALTVTVCEGTSTNSYVPIYGSWADADQHNQMIYPASALTSLVGMDITGMVFHLSSGLTGNDIGNWTVSLGITNATTLTGLDNTTTLTQVYSGAMTFDTETSTMSFDFADKYSYNGGNLLVDFTHTAASWREMYFYGISATSAAVYQYSSYSAVVQNFLPMVTFPFEIPSPYVKPQNLAVTNLTNNSATVTWEAPADATPTGYKYQYKPEGGTWSTLTSTTNLSAPLTGLTGNTNYTFQVQAIYDGDNESGFASTTFTTDCDVYPIPYSYGFETAQDLNCWTIFDVYGRAYVSNNTAMGEDYARTGEGFFIFTYKDYPETNPQYMTLISPELTGNDNGLHVEFYYLTDGQSSYPETFRVGYSTTNTDLSSFTWSNTITDAVAADYQLFKANYPAGTKFVAVQHLSDDMDFLVLDDFSFTEAPSCTEPSNLQVSNITTSGAALSWIIGGEATAWDIYVTDDETDVPADATTPTYAGVTSNTNYPISGLTSGTTYYVYVRSACDATTHSDWTMPTSFNTACEAISLPYQYDFEDDALPLCWNTIGTNSGWITSYISNTAPQHGSKHFVIQTSNNATGTQYVVLPEVDANYPLSEYQIAFYSELAGYSTSGRTLAVGVMTDPEDATTFVQIGDAFTPTTTYAQYKIRLNTYTGNGQYIAIKHNITSGPYSASYTYIDNLEVNLIPSCIEPSALTVTNPTAHGATFAWTAGATTQNAWQLYFSETNVAPEDDETNVIDANSNPFTLTTGLNAETDYYVWVRANCDGTAGNSPWFGPQTFTTAVACPAPENLAVTDGSITANGATITWTGTADNYIIMVAEEQVELNADFEDNQIPSDFTTSTDYPWTAVANNHSGAYCAKSGNGGNNSTTSYMEYEVTLTEEATLTFSAKISSESNWDKGYFSIDGTIQTNINGISGNGSWNNYIYTLTAGTHTLRWYYTKDSSGDSNDDCFYVDDIKITTPSTWDDSRSTAEQTYTFDDLEAETPYLVKVKADCGSDGFSQGTSPVNFTTLANCPVPTGLASSDVSGNSATISWDKLTADGWVLQYGTDENFGTGTYTEITAGFTVEGLTVTANLSGLDPLTTYYYRVQSSCESDWSAPVMNFTTTAVAVEVGEGWSDDFEGTECGWELINGTLTNNWVWGTAACTGEGSTKALYVSKDGGATNTYSGNNTKIFATKLLTFDDAKYEFSYDWRCQGESTWDFLRVALVPASQTLTAGTDYSTIGTTSLPSGWIALDGGKLNLQETWQNKTFAIDVVAGNYYLVLAWRNDSDAYDPAAAVDNVSITRMACPYDVEDLAVADGSIATDGATLTWNPGEAEQWQVAWSIDNSFANTQIVTTPTIDLTGLTHSSIYNVKVRAYCGGEDYGSWSEVEQFTTLCEAIEALGYTENFDSYTSGNGVLPVCWQSINNTTYSYYQGYPRILNSNSSSTPNCLYFYSYYYPSSYTNYDPQPQYAILPEMNDLAGKRITLKATGANTSSTFKVGTMSNPTDASTFTLIAEQTGLTTSYEEYTFDIPTTTIDRYVAIMIEAANSTVSTNSVYIDDISINTPPNCEKPTGLQVTASGLNATATWTSEVDNYDIAYATSATADPNDYIIGTATDETYTTGALALGDYYFWVRANCGAGGYSEWQGPVSVHIGYCEPNPSSRDGKGITSVVFGTGENVVNNVDETNGLPASSPYYGDYSEMVGAMQAGMESTVTITYATGSSTVYSYGTIIWVDWNNNLSFEDDEIVYTGTSTQGSGGVPQVLEATITIPADQPLGDYRMRIAGADSYFDNYISSGSGNHSSCFTSTYSVCHDYTLRVLEAPSCMPVADVTVAPEDITTTTAVIRWTNNNGSDAKYTVKQGGSVLTTTATTSYELTSLTAATTYPAGTFTVTSNCDENMVVNVPAFTTDCDAITALGYTENFDSYTAGNNVLPVCWKSINNTTYSSYQVYPRIYNYNSSSTPNTLYFYSYYSSWSDYDPQPQYAILPEMNDLAGMRITLKAKGYNTSSTFKVGTMSNPTDASTFTLIAEQTGLTTSYEEYTFDIPTTTTDSYVAIMIEAANSTVSTNSVYIDDISINTPPACEKPTELSYANVTNNSAELSWTAGGTETAWVLEYGTASDFTGATSVNVSGTPSKNITGLTANTTYYARVKADCGVNGESEWSDTKSFTTLCEAITITEEEPYTQSFEAPVVTTVYSQAGQMPDCWDGYPTTSGGPKILKEGASYNYASTGQVLYFYGSGNNYAVFPVFTNALSELQVNFKWATESGSNGTLTLGYITDEDDNFSSFTAIETYPASSNSYHALISADPVYLNELPANATRLVFRWYYSGQYGCNVDDVEVSLIPSCVPPAAVAVNPGTIPTTTAVISWTNNNGTDATYTVRQGEEVLTADATDSYELTGLTANTTYDAGTYTVTSNCDETAVVDVPEFTTPCETIVVDADNPYIENFEATTFPPDCWDNIASGSYKWSRNTSQHKSGAASAYSGYYGDVYLVMPELTIANDPTDVLLTFWSYNSYSNDYNKNSVVLLDGDNETELWSPVSVTSAWVEDTVDLSAYKNQTIRLAFKYEGYNAHGWFVDSVKVAFVPACQIPTGLTATLTLGISANATLSWTAGGTETAWVLEYGTSSDFEGATSINVSGSPFRVISGFTANTTYYARVKADCGGGLESDWSATESFTTPCDSITITEEEPYTQSFEAPVVTTYYNQVGQMPDCWDASPTTSGGPKILAEGADYNYASTGQVLYFYGSGNNYAVFPVFTNALSELQVNFKWATESSSYGTLTLGYITDEDENFDSFTPIETYAASESSFQTLIQAESVYLNELPDNATRLVFRWYYNYQYGCNVDDVEVSLIPSCISPTNIAATNVTYNSAELSWTVGGTEAAWVLEYGTSSDFTGATSVEVNDAPSKAITGLTANTTYYARVKADCGGGDESVWSTTKSFTTPCEAIVVDVDHPYIENFEATTFPPDCWDSIASGSYKWTRNTSPSYSLSGTASAYSGYYGDVYLVMPELTLVGTSDVFLTFWSYNRYPTSYGKNSVVLLDGDNETELWSPESVIVEWVGDTIDLSAYKNQNVRLAFKYEGYNAHGWYVDSIKVAFNLNSYEITATADPTAGGTVDGAGTYNHGATATLTAEANPGYTFINWTLNGNEVSTDASYSFTVTEAADYVANFEQIDYSITATVDPDGAGSVTGTGTEFHYGGTPAHLTAVPEAGWQFQAWIEADSTYSEDSEIDVDITLSNREFIALFTQIEYNITADADPWDGGSVIFEAGPFYYGGDPAHMEAVPYDGWRFVNWTEADTVYSTDSEISVDITLSDRSFIAHFEQIDYSITATVDPNGAGTVTGTGTQFHYGDDPVTLIATANYGYHFVNWTEADTIYSEDSEIIVDVTLSNRQFVAHFELNNYEITATATDGGSTQGTGVYTYGATATLTATPNEGYHFVKWEEADSVYSTTATTSVSVIGNRTFTAYFAINQYEVSYSVSPTDGGIVVGAAGSSQLVNGNSYNHGTHITLVATPNENKEFVNWTSVGGQVVSQENTLEFDLTADTNLTANFKAMDQVEAPIFSPVAGTYFLHYDQNKTVTLSCSTEVATIYYTTDGTTPTANSTAYTPAGITVDNGTEVTIKAIAVKTGMQNSEVATATYKIVPLYDVTISDAITNGTVEANHQTAAKDSVVTLTATPAAHYHLGSWHVTSGNEVINVNDQNQFVMPNGNVLVSATFELDTFVVNVTIDPVNSGNVDGTVGTETTTAFVNGAYYAYGTEITLTAHPAVNMNKEFDKWMAGGVQVSAAETFSFTVTSDTNLTAHFKDMSLVATPTFEPAEGTYFLHYDQNKTVTLSCNTEGATIHYTTDGTTPTANSTVYPSAGIPVENGTEVTIKAIAVKTGMQDSEEASATYKIVPLYDVTISDAISNGTVTADHQTAAKDSVVTLTATPAAHYHLSSWHVTSGNEVINVNDQNQFVMPNGNLVVSATFELDTFVVNVTIDPVNSGSVDGTVGPATAATEFVNGAYYAYGTEITLTAHPEGNKEFDKWTSGGAQVSAAETFSFTLTADTNLTANFKDMALVATPTFEPAEGTYFLHYDQNKTVTLSCSTEGATIYYTTDGTTPTANSTAYSSAGITVTNGTEVTIKAIAMKTGMQNSAVASATYTIVPLYDVTISDAITNGTVTADHQTAAKDSVVTLTATPATHYHFVSWQVTSGNEVITVNDQNQFVMPNGNVVVSATFAPDSQALTIHYQYADGTEAAPDHVSQVSIGSNYSVTSPVITCYAADQLTVSGTMGTEPVEETVTYTTLATTGIDERVACDSLKWIDGITYYESTDEPTFTIVGGNAVDCDSVVTLHLTIHTSPAVPELLATDNSSCATPDGSIEVTSPVGTGYTYSKNGIDFQTEPVFTGLSTGNFTITVKNTDGCISKNTAYITTTSSTLEVEASNTASCVGGNIELVATPSTPDVTYSWTGPNNYTSTAQNPVITNAGAAAVGTYTVVVTETATSCTATSSTEVDLSQPTTGVDQRNVCDSLVWIDGITYYESTNEPTFTLQNATGCDSIVTLKLTVRHSTTGIDEHDVCDSLEWIDGITYYESTNEPTYTLTNVAGCDSVVTLHLTVRHSTTGIDEHDVCDSLEWIDGITYYESTTEPTFTYVGGNAAGCDSVVTLHLTVRHSTTGIDEQDVCDSLEWIDGITYYENTTEPTFTLENVAGCDSVVTLHLTVRQSTTGIDEQDVCDSLEWIDGITYYESTTEPTYTLENVAGCDSVVTLHLTVRHSTTGIDEQDVCDSLEWIDGITYYESTTEPTYTLENVAGCDSVVTLHLTVRHSTTGIDEQDVCDSLEWIDGITYYESTTEPTYTLENVAGCDSVVTLNLTVRHSTTGIDEQVACDSLKWIDNVTYYESTTEPTYTLENVAGCDSVVTLHLTINHSVVIELYDTMCLGTDYNNYNITIPIADIVEGENEFVYNFETANHCDSTVNLHLFAEVCIVPCGEPLVDVDGNSYPTKAFGHICWMLSNLRTTRYSNGTTIPFAMVYTNPIDNSQADEATFGRLYNWMSPSNAPVRAAATPTPATQYSLCPVGWRLPTQAEYQALNVLYTENQLRSADNWVANAGTNESEFNKQPAGFYNAATGRCEGLGTSSHFYTSDMQANGLIYQLTEYFCVDPFYRVSFNPLEGRSVRCVRDIVDD